MLIRPASLAVVTDAWKVSAVVRLRKYCKVINPDKYVVRLAPEIVFLPSGTKGHISKVTSCQEKR